MSSRVCACCWLVLGCSTEQLAPRAQAVLFIDTDAPLVGQLSSDPELPGAIAIDTLRIDRLDDAGDILETREVVASDARDWPVSLGVVGGERTRFRLRAFRSQNAGASEDGLLSPIRNLSLDRLVELEPPASFQRYLVVLSAACFNAPASFSERWTSCVDVDRLAEALEVGVQPVAAPAETLAGSTHWAASTPCQGKPPSGSVCIPGGTGQLGDETAALLPVGLAEHPAPSRVLHVAPFFLDRTELTVGRYRAALATGKLQDVDAASRPTAGRPERALCTYLGPELDDNDALPLNCVSYATARAVCQLADGDLPSEAQWEYAARGRGQARLFPWGSAEPQCCTTSVSRRSQLTDDTACSGAGIEPVASHTGDDCPNADESRDGALDMAGSVSEWTLDSFRAYDHACWTTRGILQDPRCQDEAVSAHSERGSYFNAGFSTTVVVMRSQGAAGATLGFRCAYPAQAAP